MTEEEWEVIELNQKTDLLSIKAVCPICGKRHQAVPYVEIPCICGSKYRTDFHQDIYTKKAKHIWTTSSYKNRLKFRIAEDYENAAVSIRKDFISQGSWIVSDITRTKEEHKICFDCGVCFNCLTCKECGKAFPRDKNKRKQLCPTCKSTKFVKTYIDKVLVMEKNHDIMMCPYCKSDNIRLTRTTNKTNCHSCKSTNLSETKIDVIFEFTAEKKEAYKLENIKRG